MASSRFSTVFARQYAWPKAFRIKAIFHRCKPARLSIIDTTRQHAGNICQPRGKTTEYIGAAPAVYVYKIRRLSTDNFGQPCNQPKI